MWSHRFPAPSPPSPGSSGGTGRRPPGPPPEGGVWAGLVSGFGGFRDHNGRFTFDPRLPDGWERLSFRLTIRGTRVRVGVTGSLRQILFGPATVDDGSQNLVGAITTCMGNVGAANIRQFQETEIIIAPSIKTEGKLFQTVQSVGMGAR